MPPVGFELMIPESAWSQTYVLDRTATEIGYLEIYKGRKKRLYTFNNSRYNIGHLACHIYSKTF
jgi:hypothetical protein